MRKKKANQILNKSYMAAVYLRLSKEDENLSQKTDKTESNSIANQKALILHTLESMPEVTIFDIYIDDGYTGLNFERPEFRRMYGDICSGKVNMVIVKDDCVIKARTPQPLENRHFLRISAKFRAILRPQRTAHIIGNS